MSQVSIIIGREFNERVRKKSFIITTLLMPLLMIGLMFAPMLIMKYSRGDEKQIAVIDESGLVAPKLQSGEELVFQTTDLSTEAARKELVHEELHTKVEYIVAHGISSTLEGKKIIIGSYHFVFEDEKCTLPEDGKEKFENLPENCSHLYMAIGGQLAAVICIEDPLREEAASVIRQLKEAGFKRIVMMTGDSERTAAAIAKRVGVDDYFSEVLPEDKARFVEEEKAKGHKVIMIGDGINDSPALSAADAGIAVSEGAEIAREIADITIKKDSLDEVVLLRHLSMDLMKRVHGNYRFVISFNLGLILLGVAGIITPSMSALLHNSSTLAISLKSMTNLLPEEEREEA